MKKYAVILVLVLVVLLSSAVFAQETCTVSSDGTNPPAITNCVPALLSAPFTTTVTFAPVYSFADNKYCGKGNVPKFGAASDGPALLPSSCFYTGIDSTLSPGARTLVPAGALQSMLNAAQCGDTLLLDHTATYTGPVKLPVKSCDDQHWITVRTDTSDSQLPLEGVRITPDSAGLLPKLVLAPGSPNFSCQSGANHYRLLGLNFARSAGGTLNAFFNVSGCSQLIFDRILMAGNPGEESCHGIQLNGSTNVAVVDSYIHELHGLTGAHSSCDSQTIGGGNSTLPMGPYKVVDNYLEASGENIMFGGGPGTMVPADIEIRRNDLYKPMAWKPTTGPPAPANSYVTKNLFELKNAARLLFEDNQLANNWGAFTQTGRAIVLTAKTQGGGNPNAEVHDITIRNVKITHVCGALAVGFIRGDLGDLAKAQYGISIHDVTATELAASDLYGCGNFGDSVLTAKNIAAPTQPMHDVAFDHITETLADDHIVTSWLVLGGPVTPGLKMYNFSWTNSVFPAGRVGVWAASGGTEDCASAVPSTLGPKGKFDNCFANYQFTGNTVVGASSIIYQKPIWP